jgi:putative transcription factor
MIEMQCELCGMESSGCRPALVDGVKMMLCPGCMKHGTGVKDVTHDNVQKSILGRIRRPREKDVYVEMDKELVSGWNDLIKSARKKKGISREKLGFNIGERTITISKIENGDLRPSDEIVSKLEKELKITLVEKTKEVPNIPSGSQSVRGLTLGDFLKTENK